MSISEKITNVLNYWEDPNMHVHYRELKDLVDSENLIKITDQLIRKISERQPTKNILKEYHIRHGFLKFLALTNKSTIKSECVEGLLRQYKTEFEGIKKYDEAKRAYKEYVQPFEGEVSSESIEPYKRKIIVYLSEHMEHVSNAMKSSEPHALDYLVLALNALKKEFGELIEKHEQLSDEYIELKHNALDNIIDKLNNHKEYRISTEHSALEYLETHVDKSFSTQISNMIANRLKGLNQKTIDPEDKEKLLNQYLVLLNKYSVNDTSMLVKAKEDLLNTLLEEEIENLKNDAGKRGDMTYRDLRERFNQNILPLEKKMSELGDKKGLGKIEMMRLFLAAKSTKAKHQRYQKFSFGGSEKSDHTNIHNVYSQSTNTDEFKKNLLNIVYPNKIQKARAKSFSEYYDGMKPK